MSYENKLSSGLPWEGYYYSAYGIAVKHGYKGTEAEWVKDLFGGKISAAKSAAEAAAMRSGAISAAAAAREAAGDAEDYAQLARNFIGIPKTAMSAAAMTDTTAIYVYCGDEAGYSFGHWYYHGNGAWNDGGAYFAATQMVTDEYGSVYTSADERAANLREAEETPVYSFMLGDFMPGRWNPSLTPLTGGWNTSNHPITYDPTMWVEITDSSVGFYLYLGEMGEGGFMPRYAIEFKASSESSGQTITLRAYEEQAKKFGSVLAFGFTTATPPFTLHMGSPVCRLIGTQTPTFTNVNLVEWPVDDRNAEEPNRGAQRIIFYASKNIYTYGAKYVFAAGLPIDCVFERYVPADGGYEPIPAEECGFPVSSTEWWNGETDGLPGSTVYPRWAKIPEDCGRMRLAVFGIQRPTGRNYLGNVILDVIQGIGLYHDAERESVPSPAIGRAIRNAKALAELRYPAGNIRTRYYNFHPYPWLTPGSGAVGIPYGQMSPGISGSYYSFLCSVKSPYSISQAHYLGTNGYWGHVCVTFISQALGFSYFQGTEWWLQNFGNRMKKLRPDTVLHPGDLIISTHYYPALPDELKDVDPIEIEEGEEGLMVDVEGVVYLYKGYAAGYKHGAKYWYKDGTLKNAPKKLSTHAKIVVGTVQNPETGHFSGYLIAEETNIWTRCLLNNILSGNDSWYLSLPSLHLETPLGEYRTDEINTEIPTIRQTYRYQIDKDLDTLADPYLIDVPPVQPRLGDMTLIHGEFISGSSTKKWSGNYAKLDRPFGVETINAEASYKWGRLVKDAEDPVVFPLGFLAWGDGEVRRYDELVIADRVQAPGDYQLSVSADSSDTAENVDSDSWSIPCRFRHFVDPVFSVDDAGAGDNHARRITITSLGSFDEVWARCTPAEGAVVDGERLPYANYVMVHVPYDPEQEKYTWIVPEEYSHVSRIVFIDNSYGAISIKVANSDYDERISYAGNAEGEEGGGDDEPEEE